MKKNLYFFIGLTLVPFLCLAQVGIGTMTPNEKSILDLYSTTQGFLSPRMTWLQRTSLSLTSEEAGMMVYQTDFANNYPKGLYYYNGTSWIAPLANGSGNGHTLRWNGQAWVSTSNLFNQGSSIGIGTQSPNTQLQIHSISNNWTRLQLTNGSGNNFENDGLLLGVTAISNQAHLIQQENKPLWFGTNATERMRIDSVGNVGIGTSNPTAKLAVNGTVKLGTNGSVLNSIIKSDMEIVVPQLAAGDEETVDIACPNISENATVFVSPAAALSGLMIGYARASDSDTVEVKFMNMGADMAEPLNLVLHMVIFQ